jgi:hypothetical protein
VFGIFKPRLVIAVTVVAAVAVAGGAYAATRDSGANARQAFLSDAAKRLNVTPKQLQSALSGAAVDQLNAAVKAGKLTQAQANAIKRAIQNHGVAGPLGPMLGRGRFRGPLPKGPLPRPFPVAGPLAGAATYLGLTDAQLAKQLGSGKSLAQIAKAQGKSVSRLEQAMKSALKAKLDKAVAAKMITSAQEQQILSSIGSIINRQVNGAPARFRFGHQVVPKGAHPFTLPSMAAPPAGAPAQVPVPAPAAAY